jgi:hypothetical protein
LAAQLFIPNKFRPAGGRFRAAPSDSVWCNPKDIDAVVNKQRTNGLVYLIRYMNRIGHSERVAAKAWPRARPGDRVRDHTRTDRVSISSHDRALFRTSWHKPARQQLREMPISWGRDCPRQGTASGRGATGGRVVHRLPRLGSRGCDVGAR